MKFLNIFIYIILAFFMSQAYAGGYCLTSSQLTGLGPAIDASCHTLQGTPKYPSCATNACNSYISKNNVGTKKSKCKYPNNWQYACPKVI